MIHAQNEKSVIFMAPVSVATTATETGQMIDTVGYHYAAIDIIMDTAGAVSSNPDVMDLQETEDQTNYSAVTAFVGDTAFTIPDANTSVPNLVRFNVDLRNRHRYLRVRLTTAGTASVLCCVSGRLSRAAQTPDTDTKRGAAEVVTG